MTETETFETIRYAADLPASPRRIAIGFASGRHRACGLIELLAGELRGRGRQVEVEHLHAHLPRVLKTPDTAHPTHTQEASR
ncbi:hypothetical protein [Streptomyces sp. RKAG293]|uniref:hypothetical protein n=1 Tax=Streptomyces sp. RKAG293 TaxID=2893403 RepID=UPI00203495E7|nr:hypothetical protein [Streptomyces sp. RKAG293]MCM2424185.1 hypothetical protein [Streptomyces sp. RKAG293]